MYLCQLTSADGLLGKPQPGASFSDFRGCLKMGSPSSSWKNCSQRGSGLPKLYLYSESYNILDDGNESKRGGSSEDACASPGRGGVRSDHFREVRNH